MHFPVSSDLPLQHSLTLSLPLSLVKCFRRSSNVPEQCVWKERQIQIIKKRSHISKYQYRKVRTENVTMIHEISHSSETINFYFSPQFAPPSIIKYASKTNNVLSRQIHKHTRQFVLGAKFDLLRP